MYYFYLFKCKDGTLYCGSTKNLDHREKQHNGKHGAIYTRTHGGGSIVYCEKFPNQQLAMQREREVKRWRRAKKLTLVKGKE